jgi:sugar (pentulose or hexulose) kinase
MWWKHVKEGIAYVCGQAQVQAGELLSIGIAYQMHGLVCVDKSHQVLRSSIIWCDSRAVETGQKAFDEIGKEKCLANSLNSPGNFTASKLKWVMENEIFDNSLPNLTEEQIHAIDRYKKFNSQNKHKMAPIPTFKFDLGLNS